MAAGFPLSLLLVVAAFTDVAECLMESATRHQPPGLRGAQRLAGSHETCSALINRGTYFSIEVAVGTPPQKFDVVADTGSNTLIIPSCVCQQAGKCMQTDRCFVGTNRSSTFTVLQGPHGPRAMSLSFGSGTIAGVVVKDKARVGHLEAYMKDGLLLMTDRALNIAGHFEGILGLGLPTAGSPAKKAPAPKPASPGDEVLRKIMRRIMGGGETPTGSEAAADPVYVGSDGGADEAPSAQDSQPAGFLEQSRAGRFSMCFNYGDNGVFRLGNAAPQQAEAHGSIGTYHWGLDFRGISVGGKQMDICSPASMRPGQVTPCGAIPDSGTTMITGPEEQVLGLLETICDQWERCRSNHTALLAAAAAAEAAAVREYGVNPFDMSLNSSTSKAEVLQLLLLDCQSWMDSETGLGEMPALHFHVVGSTGTKQSLAIPPRAYVMESEMRHANLTGSVAAGSHLKSNSKVCSPAFSPMEYTTQNNGPVWILGTPFFYEFNIGYDMFSKPPTISFADEPCGSCGKTAGLVGTGADRGSHSRPRWMSGPARPPTSIDVQRPL